MHLCSIFLLYFLPILCTYVSISLFFNFAMYVSFFENLSGWMQLTFLCSLAETRDYFVRSLIFYKPAAVAGTFGQVSKCWKKGTNEIVAIKIIKAIDLWSLGRVVAELSLSRPLYPESSEFNQIRYFSQTQGLSGSWYWGWCLLKSTRERWRSRARRPWTRLMCLQTWSEDSCWQRRLTA